MKKTSVFRAGGFFTSLLLMSTMLSAMPASAEPSFTAEDISQCDYVVEVNKVITTSDASETNGLPIQVDLSCSDIGVKGSDVITQIWVNYTGEAGKNVMPAIGYSAPGYNEDGWYCEGLAIKEGSGTVVFDLPEDYPLPDQFIVQHWWGDIDTMTVNSVGLKTASGTGMGMPTRLGDVNDDKTVNIADAVALVSFLTQGKSLASPANADMDKNKTVNAADLTLLKRKLLNPASMDDSQTAMEFVSNIKVGWNLGNTLDSLSDTAKSVYSFETAWGCPYTTKAMIDKIKEAGFNTVRVPVSWGQKMGGAPDYKVSDEWMARVQEVVDYVIDDGMYCILNCHHDTDWQKPRKSVMDSQTPKLTALWTQIANRFSEYDEHLIFETLNEPRLVGETTEWTGGDAEARECVNIMNETALKAIRATGGNNAKRFVMIPPYAAAPDDATLNDLRIPDDDHIIVSIHAYRPYNFALNTAGENTWSESTGSYEIHQFMKAAQSKFISKGIPVIIGEFGALNKNNESYRAAWVEYYLKAADSYGIPCVWWDNNAFTGSGENFGLLNRNTMEIQYPDLMAAILRGVANR